MSKSRLAGPQLRNRVVLKSRTPGFVAKSRRLQSRTGKLLQRPLSPVRVPEHYSIQISVTDRKL
jgi:hypothetical protein